MSGTTDIFSKQVSKPNQTTLMATRSMIAIEKGINVYDASYCHWDGYPSYNGAILSENYTSEQKVVELLEKGDMSSLATSLKESVFFTQRGEDLHKHEDISYEALRNTAKDVGCEYIYVFFPDEGVWQYSSIEDNFCSMISL